MDRLIAPGRTKQDFAELLETPGQGTEKPFGLTKRKVKDHAEGERCFNRYFRVDALAAYPLFAATMLASYLPARRVTRIDPIEVLRTE